MTRGEIIKAAWESGVWIPAGQGHAREQELDRLERFATLVAAAERESCAKVCESKGAIKYAGLTIGEQCAAAIRARGES